MIFGVCPICKSACRVGQNQPTPNDVRFVVECTSDECEYMADLAAHCSPEPQTADQLGAERG